MRVRIVEVVTELLSDLRHRARAIVRRDARERDLDDELRFHLEREAEQHERAGVPRAEAMRRARVAFGGVERIKEDSREASGVMWAEHLARDLRYALRALRRSPGFAAVAIATLALGIGATTAVFTVIDGVLLRPLPFTDPERLVALSYAPPPDPHGPRAAMFDWSYDEFRRHDPLFEHTASFSHVFMTLTGAGDPVRLTGAAVTPDFFALLGTKPQRGRAFLAGDDVTGRDEIVVLGDRVWRGRFGADPRIVGSVVQFDGVRRTVVGVAAPGFDFPNKAELWIPLRITIAPGNTRLMAVIGRLKPGMSRERAEREFAVIAAGLPLIPDQKRSELTAELVPLKMTVVGNVRSSLLIFAGAVGLVLAIACSNVANLLLMRATSREREMSVRIALGAGRGRLVRQLLTESAVLGLTGGVLGALLATWGVQLLLALAPEGTLPRADGVHVDPRALAFALGVSLLTSVVFGLVPALYATKRGLRDAIGQGPRAIGSRHGALRHALVIGEIALAIVLLVGAGLMLRSFREMRAVELGFRPEHVLTTSVILSNAKYRDVAAMRAFDTKVLADLAAIPGVTAAGAVDWRPLSGMLVQGDFVIEGGPTLPEGYAADKMAVSPDYFRAMGIRMQRGRSFTARDDAQAPPVVVISQAVTKLWRGADPVGQRIAMNDHPEAGDWMTIVGVVDDIVQRDVKSARDAAMYQPYTQIRRTFWLQDMTFVVRAAAEPQALAAGVRAVLRSADADLPIGAVSTMSDAIASTTGEPLFQTRLIGTFSLLALALSAIAIYGALAYAAAERTHEIGIRLALGAEPRDMVRMMMRWATRLVVPGVALGVVGSLAATRLIGRLLFGVTPTDPLTFGAVAMLLAVVALVAAWSPARRASRVAPSIALRAE